MFKFVPFTKLGNLGQSQNKSKTLRKRRLTLESLEEREFLSVTPFGDVTDYTLDDPDFLEPLAAYVSTDFSEQSSELTVDYGGLFNAASNLQETSILHETPIPASIGSVGDLASSGTALLPLDQTFQLNSNPGSKFTIYLDFTGHTTTGTLFNTQFTKGAPIVTPPFSMDGDPNFSDAELQRIQYIWQRVAEDFIAFDVNVTTEEPPAHMLMKSGANDDSWGIRVVIGGTSSSWYGSSVGGLAYVNSFNLSSDTPVFVFAQGLNNNEKYIAEAITHEVGHSLGLNHSGLGTAEYYSGANGWAPIMGTGYSQAVTHWSIGDYAGATNKQDQLAIITTKNGFGYRADDHGSTMGTASTLVWSGGTLDLMTGIIQTNTDVDFFTFQLTSSGTVNFDITSGMRDANLNVLAKIYDATGTIVAISDLQNTMNAKFASINLAAGTYYMSIEGTGRAGVFSDYGSIGSYKITGSTTASTTTGTGQQKVAPPTAPASLTSTAQTANSVTLSWNAQGDLTGYTLQYRVAGTNTWTTATAPAANATSATISGLAANTQYNFQLTATNSKGSAVSTLSATTKIAAPTAPAGLTSTAQTANSVTLSWNAQSGLTGYTLQYRVAGTTTWTTATAPAANATSATISGLAAGTSYQFQLTATNAGGSTASTVNASTQVAAPTAPANLKTTAQTGNSVTLSWTSQSSLSGYTLQYRVAGTTTWTTATAPAANATSATISGLAAGTSYQFQLTASNAGGSAVSTVNATTKTVALTAPTGVAVVSNSSTTLTVNWNAVSNASGYIIEYSTAKNFNKDVQQMVVSSGTASTAEITGLSAGTQYYVRMVATGTGAYTNSGTSSTVNATTQTLKAPTAPASFTSTVQTTNSVTLSWNAQSNLTGYTLQYRVAGTNTWTTATAPAANATSATISGLAANTQYNFQLTATNSKGSASSTTNVTTQTSAPTAPAGLTSTAQTANSVTLSWNAQSNLTGYTLQYRVAGTNTWTTATAPAANATSATITGLAANTSYDFQLTATNAAGSAVSTANAATSVAAPTAPASLTSTAQTANSVTLSWNAQSDLTGYTLQYRVAGTNTWTTATAPATNATNATISGLSANTTYDFQLTATNSKGSASSTTNVTTQTSAPTAPAGLTSTAQTANSVTLSWNAQSDLTGYTLQYRVAGTNTWTTATAPAANATSATISGLAAKTSYEFQLTATNTAGTAASTVNVMTSVAAPTAPANLASWTATINSMVLMWTAQSDLTGYTLEYRVAGTTDWITATAPAANATFTTITGLAAGTSYEVQLTATNAAGSATSTTTAKTRGTIMPSNLTSTVQTFDSVTLSWTAPTDAVSYTLQYRAAGTTAWTTATSPATDATSATITGLAANTSYDFQLTATNAAGSAASTANVATSVTAPTAPANLASWTATINSMVLMWAAQSDLTGYTLEYRVAGTTDWITATAPAANATFTTITGLAAGTSYEVQLTATNAAGSATSTTTAKTRGTITPSNLTSTVQTFDSVTLSWTAPTDAVSYTLQYRVAGTTAWTTATSPAANATSATITGLAANTSYDFQLTAKNADGNSSSAAMTNAMTSKVVQLSTPTSVNATSNSSTSLSVSWNAVGNASGYIIQIASNNGFNQNLSSITVPDGATTTIDITGLNAGTRYYVRMVAIGTGGYSNSGNSSSINLSTLTVAQEAALPKAAPVIETAPVLAAAALPTTNPVNQQWAGISLATNTTLTNENALVAVHLMNFDINDALFDFNGVARTVKT